MLSLLYYHHLPHLFSLFIQIAIASPSPSKILLFQSSGIQMSFRRSFTCDWEHIFIYYWSYTVQELSNRNDYNNGSIIGRRHVLLHFIHFGLMILKVFWLEVLYHTKWQKFIFPSPLIATFPTGCFFLGGGVLSLCQQLLPGEHFILLHYFFCYRLLSTSLESATAIQDG